MYFRSIVFVPTRQPVDLAFITSTEDLEHDRLEFWMNKSQIECCTDEGLTSENVLGTDLLRGKVGYGRAHEISRTDILMCADLESPWLDDAFENCDLKLYWKIEKEGEGWIFVRASKFSAILTTPPFFLVSLVSANKWCIDILCEDLDSSTT